MLVCRLPFRAVHIGTYYQNHGTCYVHLRGGLHVVRSHNTLRLVHAVHIEQCTDTRFLLRRYLVILSAVDSRRVT